MAVAVAITNLGYTAADLRRLMSKERVGEVVRRLSALALVLEGHSRTVAAAQSGMDRQTLRDWVHLYHEGGVAALASGKNTVRRPKLDAAQMAQCESAWNACRLTASKAKSGWPNLNTGISGISV